MTPQKPMRSSAARYGLLGCFAAAALLAACDGGADKALPLGYGQNQQPAIATVRSPLQRSPLQRSPLQRSAIVDAGITPAPGTVARQGTVIAVSPHAFTLRTWDGDKFAVSFDANTQMSGGTPRVGQFAQVVGRGTTQIQATYLALWQTPPARSTYNGIITARTANGFLLATSGKQAVPVVLSSQIGFSGQLFVGDTVQAVAMGTASRGVVASKVRSVRHRHPVPTPSPSPTSSATSSPTPSPTSSPTKAPSPSPSPSPPPSPSPSQPPASPTPSPVPTSTATAPPAPTPTPNGVGVIPPQGVFNSCEIDTALSTCEQEDQAMRQTGLTWEANFIGVLAAHKTGANSLQSWFQYDASIGMSQFLVIKQAINDPVNVLTGNILITGFTSSLANDCGATNNEQVISCIVSVAQTVPSFNYMWDLYDEPGCPNQSLSYCPGTLAGGNYNNFQTLASYIHSIDPAHGISGVNVGDCCNGSSQAGIDQNLFSWLAASPSTGVGWDYYPIPQAQTGQPMSNLGTDTTAIANYLQANHPGMPMNMTLQAFSWYQEGGFGCTSITMCPFPTQAQMQNERDEVLYYANQAHQPISVMFWYYWPDITCLGSTENYSGCSASANEAALKGAITAPFPATAPSLRTTRHRTLRVKH